MFDVTGKRVWVAGHAGMLGSALVRRLEDEPIGDLITASSKEVDLRRQEATETFVQRTKPQVVLMAAARVGGIEANRKAHASFLYENLMIAGNTTEAARLANVEKFVMVGSSAIYPRESPQPISEDAALAGLLEPTNEGYGLAKIAALELAKLYRRQYGMNAIFLAFSNLYGPNDNYDPTSSHVVPALFRKIHEAKTIGAKSVEILGTGRARREFVHADDAADAAIFCLKHYEGESHLNVGAGKDISIKELAELIAGVVGWAGDFAFNTAAPDGAPRRLLDVARLTALGWTPRIPLSDGLQATYADLLRTMGSSEVRAVRTT